jgi:hypothetical protein
VLILQISVDSHRKAQPPQARQGQEIEHRSPGRPQKECDRAAKSSTFGRIIEAKERKIMGAVNDGD